MKQLMLTAAALCLAACASNCRRTLRRSQHPQQWQIRAGRLKTSRSTLSAAAMPSSNWRTSSPAGKSRTSCKVRVTSRASSWRRPGLLGKSTPGAPTGALRTKPVLYGNSLDLLSKAYPQEIAAHAAVRLQRPRLPRAARHGFHLAELPRPPPAQVPGRSSRADGRESVQRAEPRGHATSSSTMSRTPPQPTRPTPSTASTRRCSVARSRRPDSGLTASVMPGASPPMITRSW